MQPGALPCISIIVPVHNACATLPRCMDSLLCQDYPNLDIVLSENGSTDDSAALCDAYARDHDCVQSLHILDKGVSNARNQALQHARGAFILFVDSDDELLPGACSHLLEQMADHDLCIAHFHFILNDRCVSRGLLKGTRSLTESAFLHALIRRPGSFYFSALWNKMYRADMIHDHALQFDPALDWGEDFAFNMQYNQYVKKVRITDQCVYNYYKSIKGASITTMRHPLNGCKIKWQLYKHFKALTVSKGIYRQNRLLVSAYLANITLSH